MEPMKNETPPSYHVYIDYGIDVASLWGDRCVLANEWWLLRGVTYLDLILWHDISW